MTLLLPKLTKGPELSLRVWRQRRAFIAPIGRVFPKAPDLSLEPDETLDLTTVSLVDKLPDVESDRPTDSKPFDGLSEKNSEECFNLPELPGLPSDRRAGHTSTKPRVAETPVFCLRGEAQKGSRTFAGSGRIRTLSLETSVGGMALKKICSQLQPWLENTYGRNVVDMNFKEELCKLLFIKKMRIYLEVRKKAYSPEVKCVPIFHCPRCLEHWTEMGWAPEACDNELQPTRGPEVNVKGTKMRFIPAHPKGMGPTLGKGDLAIMREKARRSSGDLSSVSFPEISRKKIAPNVATPTAHPSRDSPKRPRDLREHFVAEDNMVETGPGLFTVTEATGEKIHINQEILGNLNIDDMSDDECIALLFECRAVTIESVTHKQPPPNFDQTMSYNYDEFARERRNSGAPNLKKTQAKSATGVSVSQGKPDTTGEDKIHDIHVASHTNIDHADGGIARRVSRSFDSLLSKESNPDLEPGGNVKVDIKLSDSKNSYACENIDDLTTSFRAKDLPLAVRNRLIKILRAQRERRALERKHEDQTVRHDTSMEDDDDVDDDSPLETKPVDSRTTTEGVSRRDSKASRRRRSNVKGHVVKGNHISGLEAREECSSDVGLAAETERKEKRKNHDGSEIQWKEAKHLPQRSKRILDKRKQSVLTSKTAWEDPNACMTDEPVTCSTPVSESTTDAETDARRTSVISGKTDHFREASEVLKYTEKQRRRRESKASTRYSNQSESPSTGKTPLGSRPGLDSQPTLPVHKEVDFKEPKASKRRGNESFSYAQRRTSSFGWPESSSSTSSHVMQLRQGSIGQFTDQDPHGNERRISRRFSKKERKEKAKRPRRAHPSKDIHELSELEDEELSDEKQSHVTVADASQWFQENLSFCGEHSQPAFKYEHVTVEDHEPAIRHADGSAVASVKHAHRQKKESKRTESLKKLVPLHDDFHAVVEDIGSDPSIEVLPPQVLVVSASEEKGGMKQKKGDEEGAGSTDGDSDLFEEVISASRNSSFSKFNFLQEIRRLPLSNAFTFSFYELPVQHRQFNQKVEMAAKKLANNKTNHKTRTKNLKKTK